MQFQLIHLDAFISVHTEKQIGLMLIGSIFSKSSVPAEDLRLNYRWVIGRYKHMLNEKSHNTPGGDTVAGYSKSTPFSQRAEKVLWERAQDVFFMMILISLQRIKRLQSNHGCHDSFQPFMHTETHVQTFSWDSLHMTLHATYRYLCTYIRIH